MWTLASTSGLDVNSPYAYVLWGHHHRRTTLVAERDGQLVGFVLGYIIPTTARDLFIWQIGVDATARGTGLASRMLDTLASSVSARAVEATVTTSNEASDALFRSFARRHGAQLSTVPCFPADHFPTPHEPEDLYRIDLRAGNGRARRAASRGENHVGTV